MYGRAVFVGAGGGYASVSMGTHQAKKPGPHEITVRIRANSLNYHDYAVVSGLWGPSEPRIPMADGAGEVVEIGAEVTDFKAGDAVVSVFFPGWDRGDPFLSDFRTVPGDGVDGYAREWVTLPSCNFTHAPKTFTHTESATLTTAALTAWRCLMVDAAIKPGDTLVVQGTGGVSIFALQFAKMAGARVIATTGSEAKEASLLAHGADAVINYRTTPIWSDRVLELTDGRGADHALDVAGTVTLPESINATRVGGHISLVGILSGMTVDLNFLPALLKQIRLQGVLVGSRWQQMEMIRAIDQNRLKPLIAETYPLESMVEAFQFLESQRHFGKICLSF